jgi:hypothetical protein
MSFDGNVRHALKPTRERRPNDGRCESGEFRRLAACNRVPAYAGRFAAGPPCDSSARNHIQGCIRNTARSIIRSIQRQLNHEGVSIA